MGTGELRKIHSRVAWMFFPVDKSMTVSAPHLVAQRIFSTSSSMLDATAELPMLALILTRKLRPMIIGSFSGWLMLTGMMARPAATSSRTNSGVISFGMRCGNFLKTDGVNSLLASCCEPACCLSSWLRTMSSAMSEMRARPMFSRMAMNSISGVMMPARAYCNCVTTLPAFARSGWRRWPSKPGNSTSRFFSALLANSACLPER